MERSDLGAVLTVVTSQIDLLVMGYSRTTSAICKWVGPLCGALCAFVHVCTVTL
jgi:hypothetical protein